MCESRQTCNMVGCCAALASVLRASHTRGLVEALGTVSYGENQDEVFLGMSVPRTQNASEVTVQKIDTEIRRFVPQPQA
jgi:ATP-dependent Zn protease